MRNRDTISPQPISWRAALWGSVLLLLTTLPVPVQAQDMLQKAVEEYQFAEYDRAIDLFSKIAQDPTADREVRKEALRYLGRAYIAKNRRGEAREAIERLVLMEPPLVELDPDIEPPPVMDVYYEVRKNLTGYEVEKKDPGLQTLAIMDFANNSIDERERYDGLTKGLASMMINFINGATDLRVVERERVQWLLKELKMQREDGIVDPATAVRTGKMLGANAVVFGSYTIHEDRLMLLARVVKVETGEVLLGRQVTGKPDEFFSLIEDLSGEVTRAVNVAMEEAKIDTRETKSLDAMMAYSDGLDLMEDGNYRAAYEKFLEALNHDDSFDRARLKAESLRPLLVASVDLNESEPTSSSATPSKK